MKIKIIILTISFIVLITSCKHNKDKTQWIAVTDNKCRSYGGTLNKGVCFADWKTANAICEGIGGKVPRINMFISYEKVGNYWTSHQPCGVAYVNNYKNYVRCVRGRK